MPKRISLTELKKDVANEMTLVVSLDILYRAKFPLKYISAISEIVPEYYASYMGIALNTIRKNCGAHIALQVLKSFKKDGHYVTRRAA